ncbi:MAG: DNA-3-methyladenine glycosylase 2 family protein [Acidobacteria bacterium]|nr:DNA-3-methyladenine glycosylase 2 family protein [Acidobacteriota bacterium]
MLTVRKLNAACIYLAATDPLLAKIYNKYGPPPLWDRPPGFATLLHIILEQQVSLASAKACFDKLNVRLGTPTPRNLLTLTDAELKLCGFSRQKAAYARYLAESISGGQLDFEKLKKLMDDESREYLMRLNGVGRWTADIYLLMAMLRPDIMPRGDLALHVAWQKLTEAAERPSSDEFLAVAERWRPHRSTAARLLWHFYLSERAAWKRVRV